MKKLAKGGATARHAVRGFVCDTLVLKVWMSSNASSRTIGHTITIDTNQPDLDDMFPGAPA
jgi:hypothetical protein